MTTPIDMAAAGNEEALEDPGGHFRKTSNPPRYKVYSWRLLISSGCHVDEPSERTWKGQIPSFQGFSSDEKTTQMARDAQLWAVGQSLYSRRGSGMRGERRAPSLYRKRVTTAPEKTLRLTPNH